MKNNIILLHGALGSKAQFSKLENLLSEDFNVYSFNFEGHGGNSSKNDFSIELFTQNVMDFMGDNGIEKSNFFGYSMGGYVALNLAKSHPGKVEKIMTLATKFNWTPEIAANEVKMLNPEKIEEKVPKFAAFLKTQHEPVDWKIVMQKTAKMMQSLGNGKAITIADLQEIETEALLCIGSLDKMVSVEETAVASEVLKNGEMKILKDVVHPFEKVPVEIVAKEIVGFL